jgi:hypothetical protein
MLILRKLGSVLRHQYLGALALFVALGGGAYAAGLVGGDGTIKACVAKSNGAARIVDPGKGCAGSERPVTWKQHPTAADFAAEPVHLVKGPDDSQVNDCSHHPGYFCVFEAAEYANWENYGHGYASVGYWRDRTGVVHLQGVAGPHVGGFGDTGPVVFYLPEGYRPAATREFPANQSGNLSYVDVQHDGAVKLGHSSIPVALDGISFRP